ncbi:MAG: hypothetical protein LBR16_00220 [Treponema sp.]|jgi:hypothetical protein|nr:hypothetical protein [Treponema sp.]
MNLMKIVSAEVKALLKQNGLPCPTSEVDFDVPKIDAYTQVQLTEDLQGINDNVLYIIWTPEMPCKHEDAKAVIKSKDFCTSKINPSDHWCKNQKTGYYCLYVGDSEKNFESRMQQHFSLCSQKGRTYSLWMQSWKKVPSPIFVTFFGFKSKKVLGEIKKVLWHYYKPLLGSRKPRCGKN